MNSDFTIRVEEPRDFRTVETLTRESFWNVYHPGCTEQYVLHCFRDNPDFIPELSLVMEKDGFLAQMNEELHSNLLPKIVDPKAQVQAFLYHPM